MKYWLEIHRTCSRCFIKTLHSQCVSHKKWAREISQDSTSPVTSTSLQGWIVPMKMKCWSVNAVYILDGCVLLKLHVRCDHLPRHRYTAPQWSNTSGQQLMIVWMHQACRKHHRSFVDKNLCTQLNIPERLQKVHIWGQPSARLLRRLQSIQNAAARLVTGVLRCNHITPILQQLHWLPVQQHVLFKIAVLVFQCLAGQAPSYLSDDC